MIHLRQTFTIPNAQAASGGADMQHQRVVRILVPASLAGAQLRFDHSVDGATWYPATDAAGAAIQVPITAAAAAIEAPAGLAKLLFLRLRTTDGAGAGVNQSAVRTFTVLATGD